MCGIVGIIRYGNDRTVDEDVLVRMRDTMEHRGPDDCGLFVDGGVGLGHRRLSILDLSPAGRQPMSFGSTVITFNGEIYNYREIRGLLIGLGHSFQTETDTEVILHAYAEWGTACLHRFNGMFSFVIVDTHKMKLFMARDRLGEKPLYYLRGTDSLVFASEIKAICEFDGYQPEINRGALFDFIRYTFVPGEETLFVGVKEFLPGHYVELPIVDLAKPISPVRYWDLPENESKHNLGEAQERVETILADSVGIRMIADVPVGVQLSGGIDSSLVAAYASRKSGQINAISVNVPDDGFSERKYAEKVASQYGLEHHVLNLDFPDLSVDLDRLIYVYDEPLPYANSLGIYLLSRFAKDKVTVLLSGEGADELFCGYERYYQLSRYDWLSRIPFRRLRSWVTDRILPGCYYNYLSEIQERPFGDFYIRSVYGTVSDREVREALNFEGRTFANGYLTDTLRGGKGKGIIGRASRYDLKNYLVALLQRQDRMSMAFSIENRAPFLDHRLVEYVYSLPGRHKVRGKITKFILKRLACRHFGHDFAYRSKMGFGVPVEKWLRSQSGDKLLDGVLSNGMINGDLFRREFVEGIIGDFRRAKAVNIGFLWTLVTLSRWTVIFFGQDGRKDGQYDDIGTRKGLDITEKPCG